jgi:hypothetical protein
MKSQMTLTELAAEVSAREDRKLDLIADTRSMQMEPTGELLRVGQDEFQIGRIAHEQIGERLEIPTKYYRRMQAENASLLAVNVNSWFNKNPEPRMLRTLDGTARAFLSQKYARFDDKPALEVGLEVAYQDPTVEVVACAITEEKTHLKWVSRRTEIDVKVGDPVQFGVAFSNSEVGRGRLSASLLVYRLICKNGAVSQDDAFGQNHVGRRTEINLGEIFQMDTLNADAAATMLKLRDFTRAMLSPERINAYLEKLRGLNEIKVDDPVKAIEKLGKAHGLAETERKSILAHLIQGGDLSGYGLHNAVTAAAQDEVLTYDRAHDLEVLGGKLVTLAPSQWKVLTADNNLALAA